MRTRSISPGEALLVYGITRLAARIYDLRLAGYQVSMKMHSDPLGRKYARYRLKR